MQEFNFQFLKKSLIIILFLFPNICFSTEVKRSFIAWGTNLDFIVHSNKSAEDIDHIIKKVQKIPLSMNEVFNASNNNSELSLLNSLESGIKMNISKDLFLLIKHSKYYYEITNGYFDITAVSLSSDAGMSNKKCASIGNLLINNLDQSIIKKKKCTLIDLDGIAEGYVIKLMLDEFQRLGVTDVLINFGGNISTLSMSNQWEVSVKNPDFDNTINYLFKKFNNLSISTSSQYSKLVKYNNKTYSHIVDPFKFSFKNERNISISIVGDNPIYADAMSTALQAMPLEVALKYVEESSDIRALILKKSPDSGEIETLINSL